jgi:hypothetical protein
MFAIAANVCRERRRSAWRRSRVEVVSDDGLVGDRAAPERSHEELAGVADALAELTPNQRRAILMREWQGLSYREIAAELSLTEGAVETLLFRARRSLARKLDRSRGRVRGISNLGSTLAWGKTLLGGTAAQLAAATLVVTAGVTAASPVQPHRPARAMPPRHAPTASMPAPPVNAAPRARPQATTRPKSHQARPRSSADVAPAPATAPKPVAAPVSATPPAPPVTGAPPPPGYQPATVPPAPPAPQLPKVEVPPVPPLPTLSDVEVPPLPPVNPPTLPLPGLPQLP